VSNLAWLIVAFAVVAVAIGGYVISVFVRIHKLEDRLRILQDRTH
jgi:CcmD family protein